MDPKLQNEFFKEFQKQVYYQRFFKELKSREDGRKFQQSRKSTLILNSLHTANGNCILKKGKMLIICEVKAFFQQQFINALTNKPHNPLLKVQVSLTDNKSLTNFEKNKKEAHLSYSILLQFNKLNLQKQLLSKHKHKVFGYRLEMYIRVLSQDGGIFQHCLLVAQLALQTTKIKNISIEGEYIKQADPTRVLDFSRFLVPMVLSQINKQIIIDPSFEEQKAAQYSITNWIDIVGNSHSLSKSGPQEVQIQVILKTQQQSQQQKRTIVSKLNLKNIISQLLSNPLSPIQFQIQI